MKILKKQAFTLAEVLLTLTIVGIIASYTIPALIQNVEVAQNRIAFKQSYSILSSVATKVASNNSYNLVNVFETEDDFLNEFKPHLNYIQECANARTDGCWTHPYYQLNGEVVDSQEMLELCPDGVGNHEYDAVTGLILNNKASILFQYPISSSCDSCNNRGLRDKCGVIHIDVNGAKKPNTLGKDIYAVYLLKDGTIKPYGYNASVPEMSSCIQPGDASWDGASNTGYGCALQYLKQ